VTVHATLWRKWFLALLCVVATLACGKTGPLRPPAPRGPLPPGAVEARQVGDGVEVAFTVPNPTGTDPSQQVSHTEILRVDYPRGVTPTSDPEAFRLRGEVVATVDADVAKSGVRLVVADTTIRQLADAGIGWTLRYGVRVRDRRERPSSLVVAKDLTLVPPVAAPGAFEAKASADGVRLKWTAPANVPDATYNIYRGPANGLFDEHPLNIKPLSTREYLDATVETGTTYRYVVRTVAAEGPPFRESVSSAPATVDASDRFAPAAPTGLVGVQEGATVRLLWNPGAERDLDGYYVYRAAADSGWERLGDVVRQPSYLDARVKAGDVVRYRVTAVDRAVPANESAPSSEVEVRVAADPAAEGR
jgi:fibronectin type 3 domain-containing protein/predicted small lipoprotein YifL